MSFGYSCFYTKNLPNCFKAKIGPVVYAPGFQCYGFPDVETEITLCRATYCDWESGTFVWYNSQYRTGLTLFVTPWTNIFKENPNEINIDVVWSFSGAATATGSCTYNPDTNETNFIMFGTAEFSSEGSALPCYLPFTITYNGV